MGILIDDIRLLLSPEHTRSSQQDQSQCEEYAAPRQHTDMFVRDPICDSVAADDLWWTTVRSVGIAKWCVCNSWIRKPPLWPLVRAG